ncbi:MAG: tripartite tricarboxylate transporter substrate binding protein [Sneathiella sp.]
MFTKLMTTAVVGAATAMLSFGAVAAGYPEKPITVVIPFGPGGSHDLNARVFTSVMPAHVGQPMVVQLTPGASGQKGAAAVAKAKADGYTLLFSSNYIDQLMQHVGKAPYNSMEDFVTVARINYAPIAVIVPGDSPYNSWADLKKDVKARPGKVSISHSGNWGALFVPAAQLMLLNDMKMNMIPFQGGGPALQALLGGIVDVSLGFPSTIGPLILSGEIKVLATAGKKPIYKDVPSFAELGLEGDVGMMHRMVMAPKGIPADRLATLRKAFKALQGDKTFTRLLKRMGENAEYMDGPEYEKLRPGQNKFYGELVQSLTK